MRLRDICGGWNQLREYLIMKSTLIRWGLCWGLSLLAVQITFAQGIPALPGYGQATSYQEPPPPPPLPYQEGAAPYDAAPMPGGLPPIVDSAAGGGMGCANGCTAPCGDPGCCDACGAAGWGGFGGGGGLRRRIHTFGSVEYLSVWTDGQFMPVLVTTSPLDTQRNLNNNPNLPNVGVLGRAGQPLFGGDEINTDQKNGGRLTFGMFLDPDCDVAWVNRFTMIDGQVNSFNASSGPGFVTLARPFFDPSINPRGQNALILGYFDPDTNSLFSRGNVNIEASSNIYLAETYIKTMVHNDGNLQIDLLGGFNYTRVDNDLSIRSFHTRFSPVGPPVSFNLHDLISAKNDFYGGTIGFEAERRWGRFSLEALTKISLGTTHQQVRLQGAGTGRSNGVPFPLNGAFYVQRSNAGADLDQEFSRNVWSVVPELNVTLGYWITPHMKATFGYTGVYWTNQVQAGDVIDTRIDLPPQQAALPAFQWKDGDFWMQGMHAGLAWDF